MNQEEEMLAVNNRRLEKENKALRLSLRDQFAMAAMTGLVANPEANIYDPGFIEQAFYLAELALLARQKTRTELVEANMDLRDLDRANPRDRNFFVLLDAERGSS